MLTWDGKCPDGLNPPQRTTDNQGVLKAEEIVSPTEEYSNCLSNAKWSALKTQIQVTLYGLSGLY